MRKRGVTDEQSWGTVFLAMRPPEEEGGIWSDASGFLAWL